MALQGQLLRAIPQYGIGTRLAHVRWTYDRSQDARTIPIWSKWRRPGCVQHHHGQRHCKRNGVGIVAGSAVLAVAPCAADGMDNVMGTTNASLIARGSICSPLGNGYFLNGRHDATEVLGARLRTTYSSTYKRLLRPRC